MSTFYNSNDQVFGAVSELTSEIISDLKSKTLLPRGSALKTSTGQLSPDITAIYHAATGTMNYYSPMLPYYEPSLQSVEDSISGCFVLAKIFGNKRVAMPYIGGRIFKQRIFKGMGLSAQEEDERLVKTIVEATIKYAGIHAIDYCFVAFDDATFNYFYNQFMVSGEADSIANHVVQGDITTYSLHQCDAIVNAANMEVQFGGGISGAIAQATNDQVNIDKAATLAIQNFWLDYEQAQIN